MSAGEGPLARAVAAGALSNEDTAGVGTWLEDEGADPDLWPMQLRSNDIDTESDTTRPGNAVNAHRTQHASPIHTMHYR